MGNELSANFNQSDYATWLVGLKQRIRESQTRAVVAVNNELVCLYWQIGHEILERQDKQGWGAKVVDQLAVDLKKEFPEMKGFSRANLMYARSFAEAWPDFQIVQQLVGRLPWGHNLVLLSKLKTQDGREWYADAAIEHGWSRSILVHQIETDLKKRQGAAITNFARTLPASQSELAQQLVKEPYVLDFLTLAPDAKERDLENGLIEHLQKFLLELGKGFAFVGRQYHLDAGGQDYYLDLLFYHTRLHCHVVIDLKIDDFKPEYAGKMQFYLAVVDEKLRTEGDNPSVGLILCKSKNGIIVEYALRESTKPMGVAEYQVRILESLPKELANEFPTTDEIETEFVSENPVLDGAMPDTPIGIR